MVGAAVRLRVWGELDMATCPLLQAALAEQWSDGRAVELDLSEVEFMDVAGLRVLLDAQEEASRRSRTYAVLPTIPTAVGRVLEATGTGTALRLLGD